MVGCGERIAVPPQREAVQDEDSPQRLPTFSRSVAGRRPMTSLFLSLGLARFAGAQGGAHLSLAQQDFDGNGFVDKEEFMLNARDILDQDKQDDKTFRRGVFEFFEALYEASDIDGDGVLNIHELEFAEFLSSAASRDLAQGGDGDARLENGFGLASARSTHKSFDKNSDGHVSFEEFDDQLHKGFGGYNLLHEDHEDTDGLIEEMFTAADVSGDGSLSVRELQYGTFLVHRFVSSYLVGYCIFNFDADGDHMISQAEVDAGKAEMTPGSLGEHLQHTFRKYDHDGNGFLDSKELIHASLELMFSSLEFEIEPTDGPAPVAP
eukprot:CAMPEP_0176094036 /NCGR_PEP_ID=MMETSP0120_2-20121206/47121_1 /TAXON_ID=160619 /ORGANISM="Kryptoperidinium foliaceum, Strain CCMP 1326" /LENGTH=321 /DNA_ID=CAMNT_0017427975 /DNA_START=79 /DNA_END=1042 /DNA_ORIENTATION=-